MTDGTEAPAEIPAPGRAAMRRAGRLYRSDAFAWDNLMAANLLAAAPPIIIDPFIIDDDIAGPTAGTTKG